MFVHDQSDDCIREGLNSPSEVAKCLILWVDRIKCFIMISCTCQKRLIPGQFWGGEGFNLSGMDL